MAEFPGTTIRRADKLAIVEGLPRRTAHACHALLVVCAEQKMPSKASEVVVRDEEALSIGETSRALSDARRRGLAVFTGSYWLPTNLCYELGPELEERFLREVD